MNAISKRIITTAAAVLLTFAVAIPTARDAKALACLNCSTWVIQLLEFAELIYSNAKQLDQYRQQVQQYRLQIEQYQNMLKNSKSIRQSFFDNALATVRDTRSLLNRAQGVSYATDNLRERFLTEYPQAAGMFNDLRIRNNNGQTIWDAFYGNVNRSHQSLSIAENTLLAARRHADEMQYEQQAMERIAQQLMGADGQMDVMQTVGELTQHSAQQMMKMRDVGLMQANIAARQYADEQREANASHAAMQQFIYRAPAAPTFQPYGSHRFPRGPAPRP